MDTPDPTPNGKRRYTRLADGDWATIAAMYAGGAYTIPELANRYGVSPRAVQLHLAKLAPIAGTPAPGKAATVRAVLRSIPAPSDHAGRTAETRETAYVDAATMQAALLQAVQDAADLPPAARIRALDMAAVALDRLHKLRRLVLGMTADADREDRPLTELPIRELSPADIERMRAEQALEDDPGGFGADAPADAGQDGDVHDLVIEGEP